MQDKQLIALIILGVMAAGSLIYGIVTPSKAKRGASSNSAAVDSSGANAGGTITLPKERNAPRTSYESGRRNPFTLQEGVSDRQLTLNGIAWDEEAPQAIINDRILNVGDRIRGCEVVAIQQRSVTLNEGSQNFELRLGRKK